MLTNALDNHKSQCVPLSGDEKPCCKTCEIQPHEIDLWDSSHRFSALHAEFAGKSMTQIAKEKGWIISERGIVI